MKNANLAKLVAIATAMLMIITSFSAFAAEQTDAEKDFDWLTKARITSVMIDGATVVDPLSLPSVGANGSTITWSTSDSEVITANGDVKRGNTTKSVILTATITKDSQTLTKPFGFRVPSVYNKNYSSTSYYTFDNFEDGILSSTEASGDGVFSETDGKTNLSYQTGGGFIVLARDNIADGKTAVEFVVNRADHKKSVRFRFWDNRNGTGLYLDWQDGLFLWTFGGGNKKIYWGEGQEITENCGTTAKIKLEFDLQRNAHKLFINDVEIGESALYASTFKGLNWIQIIPYDVNGRGNTVSLDYIKGTSMEESAYTLETICKDNFDNGESSRPYTDGAVVADGKLYAGTADSGKYIYWFNEDKSAVTGENIVIKFTYGATYANNYGDKNHSAPGFEFVDANGDAFDGYGFLNEDSPLYRFYALKEAGDQYAFIYWPLFDTSKNTNHSGTLEFEYNTVDSKISAKWNGVAGFTNHASNITSAGIAGIRIVDSSKRFDFYIDDISVTVPRKPQKIDTITTDYCAGDKKATFISPVDMTAKVFVASYSTKGTEQVLDSVDIFPMTLEANVESQVNVRSAIAENSTSAKIFVWDEKLVPFVSAKEVPSGQLKAY